MYHSTYGQKIIGGYEEFTDEALERIRVSVPVIFKDGRSKTKWKDEIERKESLLKQYRKEEKIMNDNGYRLERSGGIFIYRKGTI